MIVDNIRANHEAGIVLRRLFEYLEEIFEDIYTPWKRYKVRFAERGQGKCNRDGHVCMLRKSEYLQLLSEARNIPYPETSAENPYHPR